MPRKSMDDLILQQGGLAAMPQRPEAPHELGDEAAAEWRKIVKCMPPQHFIRANYPILVQLCRHIIEARKVAQLDPGLFQ